MRVRNKVFFAPAPRPSRARFWLSLSPRSLSLSRTAVDSALV